MFSFFKTWREDLPAGLVVFLVAVPLCLGIALASEAPPFAGLIAGIIGGIVVGAVSGSAIGVSGPAAGLTAIVASAIHDLGTFELFLAAVVIAGAMQLVLGVIRAGFISYYFPNVVIKGMLAAIGIIIILKQLPHAVGWDKDPEGDENFIQVDGQNTFSEIMNSLNHVTPTAVAITIVSLIILILWERKFIQRTFLRLVPGPLIVVVLGIVATASLAGTEWALANEHRIDIGISGKSFAELFVIPDFTQIGNMQLWIVAVTLAVVASLETLLSVDASDKLDPEKRTTPNNRELIAQGIGNMASGMIGGLPVTQVIVRTSANVNSGGRTKLSTIVHGVLIALAVFTISGVLNFIPYASLAAVLFMVGYKLAKPKILFGVLKEGWTRFLPFAVTIVAVVMTDLLIGVACGLGTAIVITLIQRLSISQVRKKKLVMNEQQSGDFHMELPDFTSFATKSPVIKALQVVPENRNVKIDLSNVQVLSADVVETIDEFKAKAKSKNIGVQVIPQEQSFN